MTRNEYINTLDSYLGNIAFSEKQEILYDYQEHFTIGLSEGKTEEQICMDLGDPKFIARQYRADSIVKQAEENKSGRNIASAIFAALSLGFINLIFVIPIFITLVGVLIALYGVAFALTLSGIALFFGKQLEPFFPDIISIPAVNPGIIIMLSIALTSLGALLCIADAYITKFFYKVTLKYIKANIGVINR